MSLLIYREVLLPRWMPQYRAQPLLQPKEYWMGVFSGNQRVGFVNARVTPRSKEDLRGTAFRLLVRLDLPLFGKLADLSVQGEGFRENVSGNADFDFRLRSGDNEFRADGTIVDGLLKANVHAAGSVTPFSYNVGKDMLFSAGASGFDLPPLKPGEEIYMDAFNPISMKMEKARISCASTEIIIIDGKEISANVLETELGAVKTRAWIDEAQEVVRVETPFGFTLQKLDPKDAYAPAAPDEQADIVKNLAVRAEGLTPTRGAAHMRVKLSGITGAATPPVDALQQFDGEAYDIYMAALPTGEGTPLSAAEHEAMLASDPMVNAAHPEIQKAAQEIVAGATAPWDKSLRIYEWVYNGIEKTSVLSLPTALEVLRTKQGDCNEHTVLFTALARAAGVPARIAIGLVYSDDLGGFGYHAWPEVHVGHWIPMEPTLGQTIADATHIKLLNGGIDQWTRLVAYIGQAKLEVLAVE